MKYNIIGDIHSRTNWKKLLKDDCINIFVGDYFSPYFPYSFEEQVNVFMDIILYKVQHPETILLIGNHDDQHWKNIDRHVTRFNSKHQKEIEELFNENSDLFQVSCSLENKVLVTHAGVGATWYFNRSIPGNNAMCFDLSEQEFDDLPTIEKAIEKFQEKFKFSEPAKMDKMVVYFHNSFFVYLEKEDKWEELKIDIDTISKNINEWWNDDKKFEWFNFRNNASFTDCYGTSVTQGPMWIRPETLEYENILRGSDNFQVVGHTMFKGVSKSENSNLFFVDCLAFATESLVLNINGDSVTYEINKVEDE